MSLRQDLQLLADQVPPGSRVLDLGSGDGSLLRHLFDERACSGTGVDRDHDAVVASIRRGVPIIDLDLDTQLGEFATNSYDVVVLSRTLQQVNDPRGVLREIARIGRRAVIVMPNFGLWRHRAALLAGHMPRSRDLPYRWYESPNRHYATLVDFEQFLRHEGFVIEKRIPVDERGGTGRLVRLRPTLFAGAAIYRLACPEVD